MSEQPITFQTTKPQTYSRQCGECDICCKWLLHVVNGHVMQPGRPCFYLGDGCTVYNKRPQGCRDYHCAYIQGILPEWMKPSLSGILVSVEKWGPDKQYPMLRAIECDKKMTAEVLSWLVQYTRKNNVGLIYQFQVVWYYLGSDAFMEFFKNHEPVPDNPQPFIE